MNINTKIDVFLPCTMVKITTHISICWVNDKWGIHTQGLVNSITTIVLESGKPFC